MIAYHVKNETTKKFYTLLIIMDTGLDYKYRIVNFTTGSIWARTFGSYEKAIEYFVNEGFKIIEVTHIPTDLGTL